jgi:dihydropteroate synthase-like protein
MAEQLLFLTGRLAEPRLQAVIGEIGLPDGTWQTNNLGIKVAALMTEAIVLKRLPAPVKADRVLVPGRSRMDLASLGAHYGVPFERGPDELVDLPQFFGRGGRPVDLSGYDVRIFAEIVEAPLIGVDDIVARGLRYKAAGADVIDIGCQPETPFLHLESAIAALAANGLEISVDSGDPQELRRGALAGAHYLLSLDETTLDVVAGTCAIPVLVPRPHGDMASLLRAIDTADARGLRHMADPILDPIHFGFAASLERYAELRRLRPNVEMLMGTGNLTELTEADSQGVTAALIGVCSELGIRNVLVVQVSPHTRRTVEEHDAARRLMYRARADDSLPKGYGAGLLSLHDVQPFMQTAADIAGNARAVRDANFRIEIGPDGVHIYNRDGHHVSTDPFDFFPRLGVEADGAHAFYLGYELAKAEIAFALGKRYTQDNPLDWGVAATRKAEDLTRHAHPGATLAKQAAAGQVAEEEESDAADR